MKRYLIAVIVLLLSFAPDTYAQRYHNYAKSGISFGYLHSAYRTIDWATDELVEKNGMSGFYAGISNDFALIPEVVYIQTGLYYSCLNESKRESLPFLSTKLVGDRSEHYINIPFRMKYMSPVAHWLDLFAYVGPTLNLGLSSTLTYRTRLSEDTIVAVEYDYYNSKIRDKNVSDDMAEWFAGQIPDTRYRRLDVLFGGAIGAVFVDVIEAQIGYDCGLMNKNKGEFGDDFKTNRHQFFIGVGVRF